MHLVTHCHIPKQLPQSARAFSLLELLTVIAVISLLVAILLPSLSRARDNTRRTVCANNLNQVAKAWQMYLDGNDGFFLQGINVNINYGGQQGAVAAFRVPKPLNRYMEMDVVSSQPIKVFQCPCDRGGGTLVGRMCDYYGTSYQTNLFMIGQDQFQINPADPCKPMFQAVNKRIRGLQVSQVSADPSKLILIGDAGWLSTWNRYDPNKIVWHEQACTHNVASLDGHVAFTRIHKGVHVNEDYCVIPFMDLAGQAASCQQEVPCD